MFQKKAIIIGAGPAGLTAAYELLTRTDIKPIIIEMSHDVGGLSRTVNYKGNLFDLGGHRFFTKSDRVLKWWFNILPLQELDESWSGQVLDEILLAANNKNRPQPDHDNLVMLHKKRQSHFYFAGKYFIYPPQVDFDLFYNLGFSRSTKIILSYLRRVLWPLPQEETLAQLWINRFGDELSKIFFLPYAKKVWGRPASEVKAEWGHQRIHNLSIRTVFLEAISKLLPASLGKNKKIASLADQFLYPKFGAGQMWEEVARLVIEKGGEIITGYRVNKVIADGYHIKHILATDQKKEKKIFTGDYYFSTMPVKNLVAAVYPKVRPEVSRIASDLCYRNLIIVCLVLKGLLIGKNQRNMNDHWIYVQDPSVQVGRIEIFNNWSQYLVANQNTIVLGAEYYCSDDGLWKKSHQEISELAINELCKIGLIKKSDVLDATTQYIAHAYPAYYGSYDSFDVIRKYLDKISNFFLIGRNGMHKYNNQDHSMLTAMIAVDNIINQRTDKNNLWEINIENEHHEKRGRY